MSIVRGFWLRIQKSLFPYLEEALEEPLTERLKQLVRTLELLRIEECVPAPIPHAIGRPPSDRRALARAFIAKTVFNLANTDLLIEMLQRDRSLVRICGWDFPGQVPDKSTFSRAFAEFTRAGLGDKVLKLRVEELIGDELVLHISRDSTEIEVRERAAKKIKGATKPKRKPGRPRKGEVRDPPDPTRLERQVTQTAQEALDELPRACDIGCKVDSDGMRHYWRGMKFHVDWVDGQIPVNACTTSASLHDSQAAIPLMRQTSERVTSCYDLMDSAYDAGPIHQVSRELGHVPIIDIHGRRTHTPPFDPATAKRYHQRSTAERGNSRLKDEYGANHVRVRGAKVHMHLMFGLLALFADGMYKLFGNLKT